ncbi:glycoside hydrolase superfamily [Auriculariales sp. MPI-PUGE-AT-0066]|nr:glycoside hydrolase superfamily [Auriculariales sp. MPI-PUGE-AT-0066]
MKRRRLLLSALALSVLAVRAHPLFPKAPNATTHPELPDLLSNSSGAQSDVLGSLIEEHIEHVRCDSTTRRTSNDPASSGFQFQLNGTTLLSVPNHDKADERKPMPAISVSLSKPTPIVAAYYPDWGASDLAPESVDFDRFDWIDFAFAIPNTDFGLDFGGEASKGLLRRLVVAAHSRKKFVKLSIGGWDGSKHFSSAVSNHQSRTTFVSNIVAVYRDFSLDGIDMQYPGIMGATGNTVSSDDSANFLTFLQQLRAVLPEIALITAATQVWPFADEQGAPMSDVSAFAQVLDWILLMVYDTWGSSANPGPNAPLDDGCRIQPNLASWTQSGFPASKLVLGIPAYGYISRSSATRLRNRRSAPDGTIALEAPNGINVVSTPDENGMVTIENEEGGIDGGQVQFRSIVEQGALKTSQESKFVGAGGFKRHWDNCSSTPFLSSVFASQIITYDDPESMRLKGAFAAEAGLHGVNMFDAHGDTERWDLIDAARNGLGLAAADNTK